MAAHALPLGREPRGFEIDRITGRYRLPSDVLSELKHVLAENPQIVILELEAVAGNSHRLSEVLDPVASYLAAWPGTIIVVGLPDPATSAHLLPPTIIDRVVLDRCPDDGVERARRVVPRQQSTTTYLPPVPQACDAARAFTRRTLRTWRLKDLIWPVSLVVSELVSHSILHAETALDLTLSHVDHRIRIAVHDYGSNSLQIRHLAEPTDPLEDPLHQRGLLVVRELTRCWGVFPSRGHGKTVWALMDAG
ncbi:MAG: ATP-binding protein [Nocardioides sp.]